MRLTRIAIHGFKSFADKVDLQLEPGLTGIVGPNGCGKSNIVDALRWVSGEASPRGVRGDDMDDVIFAGSGQRPARDLADVAVLIEGDLSDYARHATDGSGEVRRTIARGHGSTFRIAGREVRAKDVQRLFQDAGAGAHGTAIVAQGQVQAVTDARPEDRRRLLEEAAGVGGLQSRKREAESKLLQTEANLTRIADVLAALETRMEQLARQAAQAERYRQVAHDLRAAEAALALARLVDVGERLASALQAADEAAGRAVEAGTALQAGRDRLAAAQATAAMARGALAELAPAHAALVERLHGRRAEIQQWRARTDDLYRRRDAANVERDAAQARLTELTAECGSIARDRDVASTEAAVSESALPDLEQAAAIGRRERTRAEASLAAAREARFAADAAALRASERQDALVQCRQRLEAAIETAELRLPELVVPDTDPRMAEQAARHRSIEAERAILDGGAPASHGPSAGSRSRSGQARSARFRAHADALPELERRHGERRERQERLARRLAALTDRQAMLAREGAEQASAVARLGERPQAAIRESCLARDAARARFEQGEAEAAAARAGLARVEAGLSTAEATHSAAASRFERLGQECRELAEILPLSRADEVVAALAVPEDLAIPLAAVLGDGLTASLDTSAPRHWRESPRTASHAVAALTHLPRLADLVEVPAALAHAMSLVWLVDAAQAGELALHLPDGGALVSRDGGLWRWDGYVRLPGAPDAVALVLAQRDRLERLRRQLTVDQAATERLHAERHIAERTAAAARSHLSTCEEMLDRLRGELHRAEQALAAAQADEREWQRRRQALAEAADRLSGLLDGLRADQAETDAERVRLDEVPADDLELREAASLQAELAAGVAEAKAERDHARSVLGHLTEGSDRLADNLRELQAAIRADEAAWLERRHRIETERAMLRASLVRDREELQACVGELAPADAQQAQARAMLEQTRAAEHAAEQILAVAGSEADRAEHCLAEAVAERRLQAQRKLDRAERLERAEAEQRRLVEAAEGLARGLAELHRQVDDAQADGVRLEEAVRALAQAEADQAVQVASATAAAATAEAAASERQDEVVALERTERALTVRAAELHAGADAAHAASTALKAELAERFEGNPLPLPDPDEAIAPIAELDERVRKLRASRDRLGAVNLLAAEEAGAARTDFERLAAERAELEEAASRLLHAVRSLDSEARQRLLAQFAVVERHFAELFARLFNGGEARLRLTNPTDPLTGGLELEASPPGKKPTSLSLLSGGEKALTALCLIFAFFLAHPSPLCVLDEVDAPLDDANVGRLIDLIQDIAGRTETRFLVVTHHPLTMARMDRLYGITMVERGVSRLVSVELGRALELRRTA